MKKKEIKSFMQRLIGPKTRKWIRILHRDLGFAMVGLSLVYGLSGILLNRIDKGDPSYRIRQHTAVLEKGLTPDEFKETWLLDSDRPVLNSIGEMGGTYRLLLQGGVGEYDLATGTVRYETSKRKPFAYWVNRLHYNRVGGWKLMADLFGGALIFLAVSGLFMVKGKHGIGGRGKWYLIIGLLIPIIYILLGG